MRSARIANGLLTILALIAGGGVLLWRALGRRHAAEPLEGSGERPPSSSEEPGSR